MATPYSRIWTSFLDKIQDPVLASLSIEDQVSDCLSWMNEALLHMEMKNLLTESDLTLRDDDALEFEEDLKFFEIEAIAMFMCGAWYSRSINSVSHTSWFVGSSGEKFEMQHKHLSSMIEARDYWFEEARKLFRDKNIMTNIYLGEDYL